MLINLLLGSLAGLSLLLLLWQWTVALRFPLHRRVPVDGFTPGITLLKPLKGCDAQTRACLESWLQQDYPGPVQTVFGVDAPDDSACAVVEQLLAQNPAADARLVVCQERLGPNRKVSNLVQMQRVARHELLVISDADVCVPPDFLGQLVAPLRDDGVGLVNCFYCLANSANLAMRLEAFAVNADFWSQVLQSRSLKPLDFALGAAMATTRARLAGIGGLAVLADYLADDYQLGRRVAHGGARIELTTAVTECRCAPMSARQVWQHQVRWARTIRACQPGPYFASILSNPTFWPLLWAAVAPGWMSMAIAALTLIVRAAAGFHLELRMTRRPDLSSLLLAPIKDLLQVLVWFLAFAGSEVIWRGQRFRVQAGGRLAQEESAAADHNRG